MPQFGSRYDSTAQNLSAVQDPQGNLIVSPDNSFGASPLGIAARTQALYGIPNANFNLLPPDEVAEIATGNELPYWQIVNLGGITAKMNYDETAQAWAVRLDPSAAGSGDSLTLTTRSYLLNDTNLTLRQKAFAAITKVGTMATNQWDLVMSATYYSASGSALSTYAIGTANSGTTWTSINGFTTSGTAIINAAAQYVDLSLVLTASAAVTGTAKVDLTSVLLQTATAGGGGSQSFLITEYFTSSATWVRPTGVDYVNVAVVGGGRGGRGGDARIYGQLASNSTLPGTGGGGGSSGIYAYVPNVYVGDVGSVIISVGAGGAGGGGGSAVRAVGAAAAGTVVSNGTAGAAGGTSSFGGYLASSGDVVSGSAIPVIGTVVATPGASGNLPPSLTGYGVSYSTNVFLNVPKQAVVTHSAPGTAGTYTVTQNSGTAAWVYSFSAGSVSEVSVFPGSGWMTGGGSGAGVNMNTSTNTATAGTTRNNFPASGLGGAWGGNGASLVISTAGSVTVNAYDVTVTAGNGGNAGTPNSGNGGAGGGAAGIATRIGTGGTAIGQGYSASSFTAVAGNGGNGDSGFVVITYVA